MERMAAGEMSLEERTTALNGASEGVWPISALGVDLANTTLGVPPRFETDLEALDADILLLHILCQETMEVWARTEPDEWDFVVHFRVPFDGPFAASTGGAGTVYAAASGELFLVEELTPDAIRPAPLERVQQRRNWTPLDTVPRRIESLEFFHEDPTPMKVRDISFGEARGEQLLIADRDRGETIVTKGDLALVVGPAMRTVAVPENRGLGPENTSQRAVNVLRAARPNSAE